MTPATIQMPQLIALDSSPLSLVTQRTGVVRADECRNWLEKHVARGARIMVAEIIDYELRRELLRAAKKSSVARLERLVSHPQVLYAPLSTQVMRIAAKLWAETRQRGMPTADVLALDIDCILAAQTLATALSLSIPDSDIVIATSNVSHLSRFVRAELWETI